MNDDKLLIKPKRPKGDDGHRVFSVRLKEDMVIQLDVLAADTGYSRNELIMKLLQFALERCEVEK